MKVVFNEQIETLRKFYKGDIVKIKEGCGTGNYQNRIVIVTRDQKEGDFGGICLTDCESTTFRASAFDLLQGSVTLRNE